MKGKELWERATCQVIDSKENELRNVALFVKASKKKKSGSKAAALQTLYYLRIIVREDSGVVKKNLRKRFRCDAALPRGNWGTTRAAGTG
jgi:hypothetical protein